MEVSTGQGWPILTEWLPIKLTNGNDGRGSRWFRSAQVRKKIEQDLRTLGFARPEPFRQLVDIRIIRVLGPGERRWDADSILRGNVKELLDALVVLGWLVDDGPRFVRMVVGDQDDTQRHNGPATVIEVWDAST